MLSFDGTFCASCPNGVSIVSITIKGTTVKACQCPSGQYIRKIQSSVFFTMNSILI